VPEQSAYAGEPQPELADLDKCTRCGLCEQACPTYKLLSFEPDSPRGRVFLMKEVAQGDAPVGEHLARHLYQCLGCRACETVCPAGVPYGKLLERARYQIERAGELTPARRNWRRFRSLAFERVLPSPGMFRAAMFPARVLQQVPGALKFAQSLPLPQKVRRLVRMIPGGQSAPLPARSADSRGRAQPGRTKRQRVGIFLGCVMRSLFGRVHRATIDVLERNGCEAIVPQGQWCCGALNVHAGERNAACVMASRNVEVFLAAGVDAVIVNAAGCGAMMKEYAELLGDNERTRSFCAKVKDVTEFLSGLSLEPGFASAPARVTYHDACHLAHGQRIRRQPRELLRGVRGLEYVELPSADECCGAAGVYNLTQPVLAQAILDKKLDALASTRASVVATANPGCAMQIQAGLLDRGSHMRVCHPVELLAESYDAGLR